MISLFSVQVRKNREKREVEKQKTLREQMAKKEAQLKARRLVQEVYS